MRASASRGSEEALRFGEAADAKPLQVITRHFLGMVYNWLGIYEQSMQIHERGVNIGQSNNLPYPQLVVLWGKSISAGSCGEYDTAIECLRHGLALSARLGDEIFRCRMFNTLGWVYGELYDLERAIQFNQQGIDLANQIGAAPELLRNAELNLGDAYVLLENWEQAQYWLKSLSRFTTVRQVGQGIYKVALLATCVPQSWRSAIETRRHSQRAFTRGRMFKVD